MGKNDTEKPDAYQIRLCGHEAPADFEEELEFDKRIGDFVDRLENTIGKECFAVGTDASGNEFIVWLNMSPERALWLLKKAEHTLISGEWVRGVSGGEEDDEEDEDEDCEEAEGLLKC